MTKIDSEQIKTYSRLWFLTQSWLFWVCWLVSAFFGALALAAMVFVFCELDSEVYWLWLLCFVVMCVVAHVNLRHTPKGYRHSALVLIILNVTVTVLLGLILLLLGANKLLNAQIVERPSFERNQHAPRSIECRRIRSY